MISPLSPWAQFGLQVLIGTIAGGMSDTVAVWMLFHPRRKILGFQGAIPKNQVRLAKSIGRLVGERLLTPEYLFDELRRSGLDEQLAITVAGIITQIIEKERGSLRSELPPAVIEEIERALESLVPAASERLAEYVASGDFEDRVARFVARTRAELADVPIGAVLTAERRQDLAQRAQTWAEDVAQSPELEDGVREYIAKRSGALLHSEAPLVERVPPPVVHALEHAIDAYLPLAVAKLGDFLHHPAARDRIRGALHDLFHRFVDDLRFHERVIAKLVVTERTFDKAIDAIERDGVEQLASLLDDDVVRDEITATIHGAIITYLQKPLGELLGGAESERARALEQLAGDYLLKALRAPTTREILVAKLDQLLERAEGRTWGEVFKAVPDSAIAEWTLSAARSARARELVEDGTRRALQKMLDRPIGKPGRFLPPDAASRGARAIAPAVWTWMEAQIPGLVQKLDLQAMVERKVLAFSAERVEELIKGVIERELKMIIVTGYCLGGLIAVVGFAFTKFFGLTG